MQEPKTNNETEPLPGTPDKFNASGPANVSVAQQLVHDSLEAKLREGDNVQVSSPLTSLSGNPIPPGRYIFKISKGQTALFPLDGSAGLAIDARVALPHLQSNPIRRSPDDMSKMLQSTSQLKDLSPLESPANQQFLLKKQAKDRHGWHWGRLNNQNSKLQIYGDTNAPLYALWLRKEEVSKHAPIPEESIVETYLQGKEGSAERELLKNVEQILMNLFLEARRFVPVTVGENNVQSGFVVQGNGAFGMEVGNVFGVRINQLRIQALFDTLKCGTEEELRNYLIYLKGEFAHEMVHRLRDEGMGFAHNSDTEIASHAVQFLFLHGENDRFNQELALSSQHSKKPRSHYDTAQSHALVVVQKKLQQYMMEHAIDGAPQKSDPESLKKSIAALPAISRNEIVKKIADEIIRTPAGELAALSR